MRSSWNAGEARTVCTVGNCFSKSNLRFSLKVVCDSKKDFRFHDFDSLFGELN